MHGEYTLFKIQIEVQYNSKQVFPDLSVVFAGQEKNGHFTL